MRVLINALYLTGENVGGSWTYTSQLVWHLTRRPSPHEFVVLVNEGVADRLPVSDIAGRRVTVPVNGRKRALRIAWEHIGLGSFIRRYAPDVAHSSGNVLPLGFPAAAVVTIHDLQYLHFPENFDAPHRLYFRWLMPSTVHRAAKIIAVSHATREDLIRSMGVAPNKIVVVHEAGLTWGERPHADRGNMVRQKWHLNRPYLLSVSSVHPHKNFPRLVQSYQRIAGDVEEDLVIVGEPFRGQAPLLRLLDDTGLLATGRVKLLGFVPREDLLGLYGGATGLVFPSLFEGFGIPALEAMECECPVISSRATSLPEVVGDAALLFDPMSTEEMAQALRRICTEPHVRNALVARGIARAREFSWERMTDETVAVYEEVHGMRSVRR